MPSWKEAKLRCAGTLCSVVYARHEGEEQGQGQAAQDLLTALGTKLTLRGRDKVEDMTSLACAMQKEKLRAETGGTFPSECHFM